MAYPERGGAKTVLAATDDKGHVLRFPILSEHGAVGEGAVSDLDQALGLMAGLVEVLAHLLGQGDKLDWRFFCFLSCR